MTKVYIRTPKEYGPHFWIVLEELAIGYPETATKAQQSSMRTLLVAFAQNFPCPRCRPHFMKAVNDMSPEDLSGRVPLLHWVIKIHNVVNARLGKPVLSPAAAMKSVAQRYECGRCRIPRWLLLVMVVMIVVLGLKACGTI